MNWIWFVVLVPLGAFVAWSFVDGIVLAPRRAAEGLRRLAETLGQPVVRIDAFHAHIEVAAGGRPLQLRDEYVGSGGSMRGERGHLLVTATRLRPPAWEMHDLQVRQRRARETFDRRFHVVESGVPVRDGWLDDGVRAVIAGFYDHPLAAGTLRVERGDLQHVAYWSDVGALDADARVSDFLAGFALVADALEGAAGRRHPMI